MIGLARPQARPATGADRQQIVRLAERFPWPSRRGIVLDGIDVAPSLARREAELALDERCSFIAESDDSCAATAVHVDTWASAHLGVGVGRMTTVSSSGPSEGRAGVVRAVLDAAVDVPGVDLLICRVDADDIVTATQCARAGFELVDREVVYLGDSHVIDPPHEFAAGLEVEIHRSDDLPSFTTEEVRRLTDRAATFRGSHIGADPRIRRSGAEAFYRSWTANALVGAWGDRLAVARRNGRLAGVFSWVLDPDVGTGNDLLDRSWAVVPDEGHGAFGAMLAAVVTDRSRRTGVRWTECDTQTSNVAVNRAFARISGIAAVRRSSVFHRWSDDT